MLFHPQIAKRLERMDIQKDKDIITLTLTVDDLNDPRGMFRVLEKMLKQDGERKIIADLSQIESIYSLQIGTLVTMHVMCYENIAVMKLAGTKKKVREVLRSVGLETLMEMHHGTDVAKESFASLSGTDFPPVK